MNALGSHKIVVISVKSQADLSRPAVPAPEIMYPHVQYEVDTVEKLAGALKELHDGDILIWQGHSNKQAFPIGFQKAYQVIKWAKLWKELRGCGLEKPPKLAMVFLASCMAAKAKPSDGSWIYQPLSHLELKQMRAIFQAQIAIAPHYEYASHTGWSSVGKDEVLGKKAIADILSYYTGDITPGELLDRFQKKDFFDRFGITFGCNGWNHPSGCACGFGGKKRSK